MPKQIGWSAEMKLAVLDNGSVRSRQALDDLRHAWSRASTDDRRQFVDEVVEGWRNGIVATRPQALPGKPQ